MSAAIDHTTQARLITSADQERAVTARLSYLPDDPLAVRIAFPPEVSLDHAHVTWVFGRELLDAGLSAPAGEGDVRLWPFGPGRTVIEFHAPEGVAVVEFGTPDLGRFLQETYAAVPVADESRLLALDRGLAALLRRV